MTQSKINVRTKQLHEICEILKNSTSMNWHIDYNHNNWSHPNASHTIDMSNMIQHYTLYTYLHENDIEINYFVLKKNTSKYLDDIINQYNISYVINKDLKHDCCHFCEESLICNILIFFDEENTEEMRYLRTKKYLHNPDENQIKILLKNKHIIDDYNDDLYKIFAYVCDYLNGYTELFWYIDKKHEHYYIYSYLDNKFSEKVKDKDSFKEKVIKLLNKLVTKLNIKYEFHNSSKLDGCACCCTSSPIYEIKIHPN